MTSGLTVNRPSSVIRRAALNQDQILRDGIARAKSAKSILRCSPDAAGFFADHSSAFMTIKGLPKLRHVGNHVVYPIFSIRARVREYQGANPFLSCCSGPLKREGEKETLTRCEPIALFCVDILAFPCQRLFQRNEGEVEPPVVRCVLTERHATILSYARTSFRHFLVLFTSPRS